MLVARVVTTRQTATRKMGQQQSNTFPSLYSKANTGEISRAHAYGIRKVNMYIYQYLYNVGIHFFIDIYIYIYTYLLTY